jgi:hypothetical protein
MGEEQIPRIKALFMKQMSSLNALVGYMAEQDT